MVASSSNSKMDIGKNMLAFFIPSSKKETIESYVLEPPQSIEKTAIWKSQELIHFCISDFFLAFIGP